MAGEELTVLRHCQKCWSEIGSYTVKKESLMLHTTELVWCTTCGAFTRESREIAGRQAAILREISTYPKP